MTEACLFSEGKQLMAYDEPSKAFLCRMNAISAFYCEVRDRLKKQTDEMDTYCPVDPVEPTPPIVIPPPEPACVIADLITELENTERCSS
jgi:hypothetical protein